MVNPIFDDEVMVQFIDISQRILGQNLRMEREYMAVMNSTISHEMRNPLNSIYSQVDVQQRKVEEMMNILKSYTFDEDTR